MFRKKSLQFRIFLGMILLVVLSFIALVTVTIKQYKNQSQEYHLQRILYKEKQIKLQMQYIFSQTQYPLQEQFLPLIFKDEIYRIAHIQNISFNIYNLQGQLLKSSTAFLDNNDFNDLSTQIIQQIENTPDNRLIIEKIINSIGFQSLYSYITDSSFKPIAILEIPDFENDTFNESLLKNSLLQLSILYFSLLILAIIIAYFLSKYITQSLKTIEKKIQQTQLLKQNEQIFIENPCTEISQLIQAYNTMVKQLEDNKEQLTKIEREQTWQKMARQIAHEIKNPLTPMKLTLQYFSKHFNTKDADAQLQISELCQTFIQQIETLTHIADSFSLLSKLPKQENQWNDLNIIIVRCIAIFQNKNIFFSSTEKNINAFFDKNQITQVLINLLKNAIQATENKTNAQIKVHTWLKDQIIFISVWDNGIGISSDYQSKIFEPQFTTKTSGSGIGLAIVKNIINSYKGDIELRTQNGTEFFIRLPLEIHLQKN